MASAKQPTAPKCPVCRTNRHVTAFAEIIFCAQRKGQFDNSPDEGGTHHANPSKRMEQQEQARLRSLERRGLR